MTGTELRDYLQGYGGHEVVFAGGGRLSLVTHAASGDGDKVVVLYVEELPVTPKPGAIRFTVYGVAQPQGSAKAFIPKGWSRPVITSDNKGLKAWRHLVADAASQALQASPEPRCFDGPVQVVAAFYLPRPKSLAKRPMSHITKPDVDKLARSLGDALSGVLYNDDRQVVQLKVTKAYAAHGEAPHATIVVTPL